jgi:glyoxylase-like metal-dependent hydrolase (beta-lactamase superfamily II)
MMASQHAHEEHAGALEHLVNRLGEHAREFTPEERREADRGNLPGRRRGESLEQEPGPQTGAAAVVLDCGTSRQSGYSHVLWISPSAESILGSHGLDALTEAIGALPGVVAYEWEGIDRLHLRAAGSDWGELLSGARAAVDAILGH